MKAPLATLVLGLSLAAAAGTASAADPDLMIFNKSKAPWTLGIASKKAGMAGKILVQKAGATLATLDKYGDTYVIKAGEMVDAVFQAEGKTACHRTFSLTDGKRASVTLNGTAGAQSVAVAPAMAKWEQYPETFMYSATAGIVIKSDALVLAKGFK